jgi:hypothetical protein
MNERDMYRDLVHASRLAELAPPMPADSEVEHMAASARRMAAPRSGSTKRYWQMAAAAAAVAVTLGVAASLNPSEAAFARDRALAALIPPSGQVLVFKVELSSRDVAAVPQTETTWIDAGASSWRREQRDAGGSITSMKVANGAKALWTESAASVLIEETVDSSPESGLPSYLVALHDLIATPDKRVDVSRVTIDDEEYWKLKNDKAYEDLVPFEAIIAVDDYRPKRVTIGGQGEKGDQEAIWTITEWKTVPSGSLQGDFFSFDQVTRLKPEGTPIQKN